MDRLQSFLALPKDERRLGPYRLETQLGDGGFAPVWLAREVYDGIELRQAALKLFELDALRSGTSSEGSRYNRLVLEEARRLCQVEHPNVVRFYSLPIDEKRGIIGLAMEHVAGVSLDRRLGSGGPLPVSEAVRIGLALASALVAVHKNGLVHRDVKPANVVEADGVVKLIDFGIAAASHAAEGGPAATVRFADQVPAACARAKVSGVLADTVPALYGTLGYVDPAVFGGAAATAASDLYGLGALLFEALAGHIPARAHDGGSWLDGAILNGRTAPPSLQALVADIPLSLSLLVESLLQPSPANRPSSATHVVSELERVARELDGAPVSIARRPLSGNDVPELAFEALPPAAPRPLREPRAEPAIELMVDVRKERIDAHHGNAENAQLLHYMTVTALPSVGAPPSYREPADALVETTAEERPAGPVTALPWDYVLYTLWALRQHSTVQRRLDDAEGTLASERRARKKVHAWVGEQAGPRLSKHGALRGLLRSKLFAQERGISETADAKFENHAAIGEWLATHCLDVLEPKERAAALDAQRSHDRALAEVDLLRDELRRIHWGKAAFGVGLVGVLLMVVMIAIAMVVGR